MTRAWLGCMRLHDADAAQATVAAAVAAGIHTLDSAAAYGPDPRSAHGNERLLAAVVGARSDGAAIEISTKVGMTRTGTRWIADGRAKAIAEGAEASRRALGVEQLDWVLLHAPDPRVKWSTTVRALGRLARDGVARRVGLCNVTVAQLREAAEVFDVAAVQVELSLRRGTALRAGILDWCVAHGVPLLAHRPLGGPEGVARLAKDAVVSAIAAAHTTTAAAVALSWLRSLHPCVVPVVGCSRPETAAQLGVEVALRDEDLVALDARCPAADIARRPVARRRPAPAADGEVVVVMGSPGAGKSTYAQALVEAGYARLNRDERGGRLSQLIGPLTQLLTAGQRRVVLDNTYPTRAARNEVIEAAWAAGVPARCVLVDPPPSRAAVGVCLRLVRRYGRLLAGDELTAASKDDPHAFGPSVLTRYGQRLERPVADEGFEDVTIEHPGPLVPFGDSRAVFVEVDGVLWDDGAPRIERAAWLRRHGDEGWGLHALAWRPGLAADEVARWWNEVTDVLGVTISLHACPHPAGPAICWCRKPQPGLLVQACLADRLDPTKCLYVGRTRVDATHAGMLDIPYVGHADVVF